MKKLGSILAGAVLISAFAAIDARADCTLAVAPSPFISRGQAFGYSLDISDFSPVPAKPQFTIVFFGTKDGVRDIPLQGETFPAPAAFGHYNLTGYQNPPSGGLSGNYTRYVLIYDKDGFPFCISNTVTVTLQ